MVCLSVHRCDNHTTFFICSRTSHFPVSIAFFYSVTVWRPLDLLLLELSDFALRGIVPCSQNLSAYFEFSHYHNLVCLHPSKYRGADKSLAQPTTRCILFDGENISFDASLVIHRMSQEECARLREGVPYVKVYRYDPKHLCPKLNVYGDNGQKKVWSSGGSTHCTCQLTTLSMSVLECGVILRQFISRSF